MSNSVNLSLDVTKTGIQNPLIKVRQGDGGFETLHVTVTSNGEPIDLQGWTITFMGTTAGNHKIVDDNVSIVEAPNGIFDYTPSKAWGMDIGEFKIAYFKFVKGDGSASSANFRVNVIEAVDMTNEEAQDYISIVDGMIETAKDDLNNKFSELRTNTDKAIADVDSAKTTAASAVQSANDAIAKMDASVKTVKVGGRNLLLGTSVPKTGIGTNKVNGNFDAQGLNFPLPGGMNVANLVKKYGSNASLTVSYDWEMTNEKPSGTFGIQWNNTPWAIANSANITVAPSATNMSGHFVITERLNYTGDSTGQATAVRFRQDNLVGNVKISNLKMEIGNVPTDWTPAPEDAPSNDAQLVHKTGTETIAGDKTFTSPINGQLAGNAATATKWQTARTLALTGDVTGSVAMDGSGNVSIATTGANLVHKTGTETIADDKTFTGTLITNGLKVSGDDYKNLVSGSANYFGLTISFVRIGKQVTFTSSANAFNTSVAVGLTKNVLPNGFKPALQQNVDATNQDGTNKFFSFDPSGSVYSYSAYTSGTQPRISGTYITADAWPV